MSRGSHPDPSVCRVGSDSYPVTSSFEHWPGVPASHSTDLVPWRRIGHGLDRPEQLDLGHVPDSAGIWAPTLRYADGVFFMVTTVMDHASSTDELGPDGQGQVLLRGRHLLVTATDPAGPWSDPVWSSGGGLDPSHTRGRYATGGGSAEVGWFERTTTG